MNIELGNGNVTIVSPEDYEYLNKFSWHLQNASGLRTYELRHAFTTITRGSKKEQMAMGMHRLVLARMFNDPAFVIQTNRYADHINFDGLDNRRENLRMCTNSENQMNKRLQRNNTTGYKGVTKDKRYGTYTVRFINADGVRVSGGSFQTVEEAALKYNEMASKIFGKFVILNEIGG
jgi:hypothetical protein